ncbi:Protein T2 [Kappamyces sp. JEL0829]|nr:Protein T2 [Kappamyces sp. JEL0829]
MFVGWSALQILDLSRNMLTFLPSSIGGIKSLRTLLVDGNSFDPALQSLVAPLIRSYEMQFAQKDVFKTGTVVNSPMQLHLRARNPAQGYLMRVQGFLSDLYDLEQGRNVLPAALEPLTLPLAPLALVELPHCQQSETRAKIRGEILSTESTYVLDLNAVHDLYQLPLKTNDILPRSHQTALFANLDEIRELHAKYILPAFGACTDCHSVGRIFTSICPLLTRYVTYLNNFDFAHLLLSQLETSNRLSRREALHPLLVWNALPEQSMARYRRLAEVAKADPRHTQINLASFLMLPVQRLPRYKLFLDALAANTETDHPDFHNVVEAQEAIARLVDYCNESKREWELRQRQLDSLYRIRLSSDVSAGPLLGLSPSRKPLGQFENLVLVKYVELSSAMAHPLSPLLLCNKKKSQLQGRVIGPLHEWKFKVAKDATPSQLARIIEQGGSLSRYDVPLVQGKKCLLYLCSDVLAIVTMQLLLVGCVRLPLTTPASYIPLTRSEATDDQAVARLCDGCCIVYVKGTISDISMLAHTINSIV